MVKGLGITDTTNGLGNLIVGYNELRTDPTTPPHVRTGSHNVVLGRQNNVSRCGGLVVGAGNESSGEFASVRAGTFNAASGRDSSVSGGHHRTAPAPFNWAAGPPFAEFYASGASTGTAA